MREPVAKRDGNRIRMYEDHGEYRVYVGTSQICEADNYADALREYMRAK